jgi:hypothetical protein
MTCSLSCAECHAETDVFERGWGAFLTDDEYEPAAVAILCPACAEREFGAPRRRNRSDTE